MLSKSFTVRLVADPEQIGIVVSEHLLPVPSATNPQQVEYKCQLGILWDSQRSPAISYWSPEDVEWISVLDSYTDDDEEEDFEETTETGDINQNQMPV